MSIRRLLSSPLVPIAILVCALGGILAAGQIQRIAQINAAQTVQATEDIESRIASIQGETGDTVTAIEKIASGVDYISGVAGSVAVPVEEQSAAADPADQATHLRRAVDHYLLVKVQVAQNHTLRL